ncbi:hypothetical protein H9657_06120 [Cellulomonas sp. Sa3CUA2]|uniref:HicB family protein n=1 Tax=Cellulomonas avistercoris TaxID=2762242 RepID=A0ABR8QBP7_9CELL|nr:hypothetical protein [Cellulomonas avistercoris]MBD7917854.1 hypothetical protein [Cellulomonas avistercoris]
MNKNKDKKKYLVAHYFFGAAGKQFKSAQVGMIGNNYSAREEAEALDDLEAKVTSWAQKHALAVPPDIRTARLEVKPHS